MIGGSIISSSKTITIGCEFNMLVCLLGHPRCRTLSLCSPENGKRGWGEVTPCVTLLKAWNWSTNGRYWKLKLNLVLTQLNANQGTGHTICEKPARASCVIFHQCSVNMTTFYKLHFHKLWKLALCSLLGFWVLVASLDLLSTSTTPDMRFVKIFAPPVFQAKANFYMRDLRLFPFALQQCINISIFSHFLVKFIWMCIFLTVPVKSHFGCQILYFNWNYTKNRIVFLKKWHRWPKYYTTAGRDQSHLCATHPSIWS